jgi:hypothetical protein
MKQVRLGRNHSMCAVKAVSTSCDNYRVLGLNVCVNKSLQDGIVVYSRMKCEVINSHGLAIFLVRLYQMKAALTNFVESIMSVAR